MAEREAQEGGAIYVLMAICVVVQQESTQHCKAVILQLGKEVLSILLQIPRASAAEEEER